MPANNEIYLYSNEGEIYRFFPHLQTQTGTVLGVGSDQVLDIYANSKGLTGAILADRTEQNCVQTQIMLEVGSIFLEDTDRMPTPEEFVNIFRREQFGAMEPQLEQRIGRMKMIKGKSLVQSWLPYQNAEGTRSLRYADYMIN